MPFPILPAELWREISRLATYTPICFDTSLHPDTWNPEAKDFIDQYEANFRTKRALALVSRQIHHISLDFLCDILIIDSGVYNPAVGIVCKQLGRISQLVQYLPHTQHFLVGLDGLGHSYLDGAARSLGEILRQCHNLKGLHISFPSLGIHDLWNSQSIIRDRSLQMQVVEGVCPGVQFLNVQGKIWENVYETLFDRVSLTLRAHHMSAWTRGDGLAGTVIVHHPEERHLPQLNSFHWSTVINTKISFSKFNMYALTYLVIGIPSPRSMLTHILESARDSILTLRLERRCVVDIDILSIALRAERLQLLGYPINQASVAWLNDELRHDRLREISIAYDLPFIPPEEIVRQHFHPISKRRFPMLSTVTLMPSFGPHNVLGVYDLEDGKGLEDGDTFRPMKLYLHVLQLDTHRTSGAITLNHVDLRFVENCGFEENRVISYKQHKEMSSLEMRIRLCNDVLKYWHKERMLCPPRTPGLPKIVQIVVRIGTKCANDEHEIENTEGK